MAKDRIRQDVSLVMFEGNMDALLENSIAVETISLKRFGGNGVILMVEMTDWQKAEALKVGFRTGRASDVDG